MYFKIQLIWVALCSHNQFETHIHPYAFTRTHMHCEWNEFNMVSSVPHMCSCWKRASNLFMYIWFSKDVYVSAYCVWVFVAEITVTKVQYTPKKRDRLLFEPIFGWLFCLDRTNFRNFCHISYICNGSSRCIVCFWICMCVGCICYRYYFVNLWTSDVDINYCFGHFANVIQN